MFKPRATTSKDFYKDGHADMYPSGTTLVFSNMTPRSSKWANLLPSFDGKVVNYGHQGAVVMEYLVELWNESFFNLPKEKAVRHYQRRMDNALGKSKVSPDRIAALHDLGYLPIAYFSLPEGARVNIRVPVCVWFNTHPDFYWLVNFIETAVSTQLWKPLTNATLAYEYRKLLDEYAERTGSSKEFVPWQAHGFENRGMSGIEDGARSGSAHLLSFYGSDTESAIDYLEDYYFADSDKEIVGGSVRASEHAVSAAQILKFVKEMKKLRSNSLDAVQNAFPDLTEDEYLYQAEVMSAKRMFTEVQPDGIISYVADTYDFWAVVTRVCNELKDIIMSRDGKVVIRPDSGDPVKIIVGDPDAPKGSPEYKGAIECLWDIFGGTITKNGFKLLDSHIGLIYGDSITITRAEAILRGLYEKGFASGNVVLGVGSFTYQFNSRDTFGNAVKATAIIVDGELVELFKDPKTDKGGVKKSARGFLKAVNPEVGYELVDRLPTLDDLGDYVLRFENGKIYNQETLTQIRERLIK
jgi:nicotinamide phosphoribosyltransferase